MKTEQRNDETPVASLSPVKDPPVGSFGRVLKNRSFLLLWLVQLLPQIVFNAANYGVIVIVTAVTHSTVMVGLAIASFPLPAVPFSLLAGVSVDYLNKRLVLWVSNALRATTTGLIVVALLWNPHMLLPLYFLTFVISLVTQFFTPAEASAIPLLVSKNDLVPALSLFTITLTIAQALGFLVLGGLLTVLFPSFHLSFGFLHVQVQSFDLLFLLRVSFVSVLLLVISELIGPFVVNVLHLPVQALPLILAPAGLGLVLGGLLMPALMQRLGKNRTITLGSLCTAAGLILIPLDHFLWSRLALPAPGILFSLGVVTFCLGIALDMVNIPALCLSKT